MAILTKTVIAAAQTIAAQSTAILGALDDLEAVNEQLAAIPITLSEEGDIISENGDVQHADAIAYHTLNGSVYPALVAWLKATQVNGKTYWNWMQSVRK
jgi:hypothetical protein